MNLLHEFLFPELGARGAIVEFSVGVEAMLGSRPYTPDVRRVLGHALAAMPLLAANTKFDGRISLQFQGHGALKLLVAQISADLQVRAMAKAGADAAGTLDVLTAGGTLGLLLEPARGEQNYQAVVPVETATLAGALQDYYARSEQVPTRLLLAAGDARLRGIVLQRLPLGEKGSSELNWEHLCALFSTLGEDELARTDARTLMHRLFHEEDLRIFDPRPVELSCRCSRDSIGAMLLSLGAEELGEHLREFGQVDVTCEFCGREYRFEPAEVDALFLRARMQPDSPTRH